MSCDQQEVDALGHSRVIRISLSLSLSLSLSISLSLSLVGAGRRMDAIQCATTSHAHPHTPPGTETGRRTDYPPVVVACRTGCHAWQVWMPRPPVCSTGDWGTKTRREFHSIGSSQRRNGGYSIPSILSCDLQWRLCWRVGGSRGRECGNMHDCFSSLVSAPVRRTTSIRRVIAKRTTIVRGPPRHGCALSSRASTCSETPSTS